MGTPVFLRSLLSYEAVIQSEERVKAFRGAKDPVAVAPEGCSLLAHHPRDHCFCFIRKIFYVILPDATFTKKFYHCH